MLRLSRLGFCALLAVACGGEGNAPIDAGLDAPRRLAITVEGPASTQTARSLKVTIDVTNNTRNEVFAIAGLPATVDMAQPIQLGTWMLTVDGFDAGGVLLGRGRAEVPSGTSATTITLVPPSL